MTSRYKIGYTEHCTDRPSRWANVITMRAFIVDPDDPSTRAEVAPSIVEGDPWAWTQFAGWSPDGETAIIHRGWESRENGEWEETHKEFRHVDGAWLIDSYLVDPRTGAAFNITAVDRVSFYSTGVFHIPGSSRLGFTAVIGDSSRPFTMDPDGRNKTEVSGGVGGYIYGFSASPDGRLISYHDDYKVCVANIDGSGKTLIETGNVFSFSPTWSPDGSHIMFLSGPDNRHTDPYVVRRDGTGLRKIADENGYWGYHLVFDTYDFHGGSSDCPVWSADGQWIYYTARVGEGCELMRVDFSTGGIERLTYSTDSSPASRNYQPKVSPDGFRVVFGSTRTGLRQLYMMNADGSDQKQITNVTAGHGAWHPIWRPGNTA